MFWKTVQEETVYNRGHITASFHNTGGNPPIIIPEELKGLTISFIVFFLLISAIGGAFNSVTSISWMAALVPLKIRGRFSASGR